MKNKQDFINVYTDNRGLWTASLFAEGVEVDSLGGSYPKSNSATFDSKKKWGPNVEVLVTIYKLKPEEEIVGEV